MRQNEAFDFELPHTEPMLHLRAATQRLTHISYQPKKRDQLRPAPQLEELLLLLQEVLWLAKRSFVWYAEPFISFPPVREREKEVLVPAAGCSCRMQRPAHATEPEPTAAAAAAAPEPELEKDKAQQGYLLESFFFMLGLNIHTGHQLAIVVAPFFGPFFFGNASECARAHWWMANSGKTGPHTCPGPVRRCR